MPDLRITANPIELRTWMIDYIGSVLNVPPNAVSSENTFDSIGLDSVEAVIMAGVMEEHFNVEIDPMLFFENPSIDTFVAAHAG